MQFLHVYLWLPSPAFYILCAQAAPEMDQSPVYKTEWIMDDYTLVLPVCAPSKADHFCMVQTVLPEYVLSI